MLVENRNHRLFLIYHKGCYPYSVQIGVNYSTEKGDKETFKLLQMMAAHGSTVGGYECVCVFVF